MPATPRSTLFPRPPAFRVLTGHRVMPLKNGPVQYLTLNKNGLWWGTLALTQRHVIIALFTKASPTRRAYAWYRAYGYEIGQEITMLDYDKYSAMIEAHAPEVKSSMEP